MPRTITIDPAQIRHQTGIRTGSTDTGAKFSEFMSAMGPAIAETAYQTSGSVRAASVAHAAVTGATVAASPQGPYGQAYTGVGISSAGISSVFSPDGYMPPDTLGSGYTSGTFSTGGTTLTGDSYTDGGLPTDPFLQQDYLINKMRDTNMQMIQIQAAIQHENRRWTTASNILKAKHDTERNTIMNLKT